MFTIFQTWRIFLSDPGLPGVLSMGLVVSKRVMFLRQFDVTLADRDGNSIPNDDAKGTIQGYTEMQVAPLGVQIWNRCKLHRHLITKC